MNASLQSGVLSALQGSGARIKVIFGGSSHSVAGYRRLLKKFDLVIVADVRGELDLIAHAVQHPNLILLPLGEGETARSLVRDASPELKQCVEKLPGIGTTFGMAQLRGIGGCATERYVQSSAFASLVAEQVVPRLLKSRSSISSVSEEVIAGASGGTGSRGAIVFAEALADALRFRLGVSVVCQIQIIGGITTVDLGPNTKFNAAANIVETADHVLDLGQAVNEARSAIFREVPAVGPDRTQRDGYVVTADQALTSNEVETELLLRAPNQGGRGRCGNLSTLRCGFYWRLDPRTDVAPDHSRALRQEIDQVREAPILPIIALHTPVEQVALPLEPVPHIVQHAWETPAEEILNAATQPELKVAASVEVDLASGVTLNLQDVQNQFAAPPQTGSEATRRLSLQRACLQAVSEAIQQHTDEVAAIEDDLQNALSRVQGATRRIHPTTFFTWLFAYMTSATAKELRLQKATEEYRALQRELIIAQARLAALLEAEQKLRIEHDFLVGRLTQMSNALDRFRLRGEADRAVPYVTTAPLDELFADLWQLQPSDSDEDVLKIVCGATQEVTVHGLAKIAGATQPRLDEIAKCIARRQVAVMGPAWGSILRGGESLCLHVLPPVESNVGDALRDLIKNLDPGSIVCIADTAVAAVNVVDLHLGPVTRIQDLFPGYYASALVEVLNSPNRALFFPQGIAALDRLGIKRKGDGLAFQPLV